MAVYKLSFTKAQGVISSYPPTWAQQWLHVSPTNIQVVQYCKCCIDRRHDVKQRNNSHYSVHCFQEISGHLHILQLNVYLQPVAILEFGNKRRKVGQSMFKR